MRRIRAVIYGAGTMGSAATRLLLEKGGDKVGAIARSPEKIGQDLGIFTGLDHRLCVPIVGDAAGLLQSVRPDVVLHATQSFLPEIRDQLALRVAHGANVITISEESLYPWSTSPSITAELHALARDNGVTITGSGHQDGLQIGLIVPLLGIAHRIERVHARQSCNADDYGAEHIKSKHVGESVEDFLRKTADSDRSPGFGKNVISALAAASGLSPKSWTAKVSPVVVDTPRYSKSIKETLDPGVVIGYSDVDILETVEGPTFVFEMSGYVYGEDDRDKNEWTITGEPDLYLSNGNVPTAVDTCTQWVNRVPDVINAQPGFITVDQLPPLRYRPDSFHDYVAPDALR